MEQPEGFVKKGRNYVCLLHKALYGLKQAGRAWQQALFDLLRREGYSPSLKDPCIWYLRKETRIVIIAVYVDDVLMTGNDKKELTRISKVLGKHFPMKDLGTIKNFLGIEVVKTPEGNYVMSQATYARDILTRFRKLGCRPQKPPCDQRYASEPSDIKVAEGRHPIREAIGALSYLANATRPDIAVAVNNIARNMNNPTERLWTETQRILRYLAGTMELGLFVEKNTNLNVEGYADADYAGDKTNRRSTTGWFYRLGRNVVSWKTSKQKIIALSTTEAEYTAAADAAKEAIFLRDLLRELRLDGAQAPILHQDNKSAIFLERNHSLKPRTKHIDVKPTSSERKC
jgi:hypothetical protein